MTTERLTFGHGSMLPVRARTGASPDGREGDEPQGVQLRRLSTWDWAWGGMLLFTILLFLRPQDDLGLKGANISDVVAIVGLGSMLFLNLSRGKAPIRVTPEVIGIGAFGLVMLATTPLSFWPGGSMRVFTDIFLPMALIVVLMINTVTSPKRLDRIAWLIVLAFGYLSTRVLFDFARGVNLVEGNRAVGPMEGFFRNPNDLALNLVAFLPLALIYARRPGPTLKRLLAGGIALLMFASLVATKSRGGAVGAVAMIATFLLVSRSLTPTMLLVLVLSGMFILPALPSAFLERMASITDTTKDPTGSREERKILLRLAWQTFLDNPLTGVGAGQFQNYFIPGVGNRWRETHNALLQVGAELGVFGVMAFLYLVGRAFLTAWWTRRELSWIYRRPTRRREAQPPPADGLDDRERLFLQTHGAAMVAAVVGWFVCAMFGSVAFSWTFYYVLGLAAVGWNIVRHRRQVQAEAIRRGEPRAVLA